MRYTHILTATATALLAEPALSATWAPRGEAGALRKRVSCGEGVGNCPDDECCSEAGYCGKETDYCKSPQCQIEFSNGNCDADEKPCGETTLDIPRKNNGGTPLDTIIKSCTKDNSIALTFDDGPYLYTNDLLDLLNSYNAKATFFVTGNNLGKGRIDDPSTEWPSILRRIHADGHQIASHTWSHEDLSLASPERRNSELGYNEMAFRNVLGFFPTYMRPPKGSCTRDSGCLDRATELGIHVVNWDLDTKDFQNNTPDTIQKSKDIFDEGVKAKNIVLSHDIQEQTVLELAEHMLKKAQAEGWTFETVGGCLGDAEENWYIQSAASESCAVPEGSDGGNEGRDEDDNEPNPDLEPSKDGTCGERSDGKYTCKDSDYGDCCSYNGFCGATSGYCDGGCQNTFGSCNKWECGDEPIVSENGLCGGDTFQTCAGSSYGNCCSIHGNCGDTEDYCQEDEGCQPEWGNCE